MKKLLVTTLLAAAVTGGQAQVKHQSHGYPIDCAFHFGESDRLVLGAASQGQP